MPLIKVAVQFRRCFVALVQVALEALDRADAARRAVDANGMTTAGDGLRRAHPALKAETESRQIFVRVWDKLNLHWDAGIDGRM